MMMGFFNQKVTADLRSILSGEIKAKFRLNINRVKGKFKHKTEIANYFENLSYTKKKKYVNSLDEKNVKTRED